MMKVFLKGQKKPVTISEDKDFKAAGGEGSIYKIGDICYKIYTDPSRMVPEEKIKELMQLNRDNIIVPLDIIMNQKNSLIGYTMKYIDGIALCRLFTTSFLDDNNITNPMLSDIVDKMVETIQFIHDHQALIVDMNEMNFMVNNAFNLPYFIDTNAYKTKSFKPDAVTPMFMDHLAKEFNELTDWYGFGILACKIYLGIHPFKGNHPNYGRKTDDVLKRMVDGVSIFNKNTTLPNAVRDFGNVPDAYMKWFIDIFEHGKRLMPPNVAGYVTVVKKQIDNIFKYFDSKLYKLFQEEVKRYYVINGVEVMYSDKAIMVDDKVVPIKNPKVKIGVTVSGREKVPFFVFVNKKILTIYDTTGNKVPFELEADDFLIHDHIIYSVLNGRVTQVVLKDFSGKQVFSIGDTWDVTQKSTTVMSNCVYMSVLGKAHILIPEESGGDYFLRTLRIQELDQYKIVDAKFDKNVLGVIGFQNGKYDRFMIMIDKLGEKHHIVKDSDIGIPYMNFVVLENGVGVSMDENAVVSIFTTKPSSYQMKSIKDDSIKGSIRFFKSGMTVLFADGKKLLTLKVK